MKRLTTCFLALGLMATSAFAGTGGCTGTYKGKRIVLNGNLLNALDDATASVSVDGRIVAHFDGSDVKLNYIFQSFKVRNNQGDYAEGKLTNLVKKTGVLSRLSVPAYGIDYRDIPMACWTK